MRVCENQALQIQPRRGDLKVAQDAVLSCVQGEISSPGGTAESILTRSSGTSLLSRFIPRTSVLGYFQHFQVAPSGLDLKA